MQLVNKKDFLIFLAAVLVVALGVMAVVSSRKFLNKDNYDMELQQIESQSESDDIDVIEKDLKKHRLLFL